MPFKHRFAVQVQALITANIAKYLVYTHIH